MPPPLLKAGRRYRLRQDVDTLKAGQEVSLLRAEYSFVPQLDRGGWHLCFAEGLVALEQTDDALIIEHISDAFEDIGPFDWRTAAAPYAAFICEFYGPGDAEDEDAQKRQDAELTREIEAVLREQPASVDPMSPKKACELALKRIGKRGRA